MTDSAPTADKPDSEIEAIRSVWTTLEGLTEEQRIRVLRYVMDVFEINRLTWLRDRSLL